MAGIGFELRKLFSKESVIQNIGANLYAGIVTSGPMIMGAILLFGMKYLAILAGASEHEQDLVVVGITYALLFSLLLVSTLSFVLSRYIADMLFENKYNRILPSMYGAISLLLFVGAIGWAIFLYITALPLVYTILLFILFCFAIVVWVQINYINAIKDYRSIMLGFTIGVLSGLIVGYLLISRNYEVVASLLAAVCITYGIMLVSYAIVLHKYFPIGKGTSLKFIEWIDKYPSLSLVGFFTTLGLFIHLMLMWASPWGGQVHGLIYHAPPHDIPALVAFFTILVTTVNFVTSLEVNFYPRYRLYFSLLNNGGTLGDIGKAYAEMMTVLKQELFYLALRQLFVTIIAIVVVGEIISNLGLGFTTEMIGLFRVLCIGYAFFAIGNSIMLYLLYFANNKDALLTGFTLFFINTIGTLITITLPENFYGFGLVAAGLGMYIVAWMRLSSYTRRLDYFVFCRQPIFVVESNGLFTRLARRLDVKSLSEM
jgi:uncharacterized membrane protein